VGGEKKIIASRLNRREYQTNSQKYRQDWGSLYWTQAGRFFDRLGGRERADIRKKQETSDDVDTTGGKKTQHSRISAVRHWYKQVVYFG